LASCRERTHEAYTRSVRMLVEFYGKPPEQITEVELEEYFLHRRNVDNWSASTLRIAYCGVRFFFTQPYLNAKKTPQLP